MFFFSHATSCILQKHHNLTFNRIIFFFFEAFMKSAHSLTKSNYYMKLTAVNTFQLTAEMYLITFLADMIIYLLHELITQYFISESNLTVKHAEKIIIIKKNFLHV